MKRRSNTGRVAPLISIAIPAYNVEEYLEECVKSLIIDSLSHKVEILIIDDGSKDKTQEIATNLARQYPNVQLISKENGGHGSTINRALGIATGKYFKLLDGDDWFDSAALHELISYLEKTEADIVLTDYVEYYSNSGITRAIHNYTNLSPDKTYNLNRATPFKNKGPLLSTTTFKTRLFTEDPFFIDENCFYVDMEYNLFIYQRATTLEYLPLNLYMYRLERDGQSMQMESIKRNYRNHEKVVLRIAAEINTGKKVSKNKLSYFLNNLVIPMTLSHYQILTEFIGSPRLFRSFDKELSRYPEVYHSPLVSGKIIGIHRVTRGATVIFDVLLRNLRGVINGFGKK